MKDRNWRQKPYQQIIRKMYIQTLLVVGVVILGVLFIRSAGKGFIGNGITYLLCRLFDVGWEEGLILYWHYVRQNYVYLMGFAIVVLFLIFFRILLSGFTHYFDEIIDGINTLADGTERKIEMSKELGFVEAKLQQVKDDLTQRTREKEEAEKRKDELIVYLAHDIKTPLTSVIGYLDLLVENTKITAEQQKSYLRIARDKALRLETLINDFFEITHAHIQQIVLDKDVVSLAYLMEQVVDEAYPLFQKAGKTVETDIPHTIRVNVDAQKIACVFTNLLKNAIYYSAGAAPICILAAAEDQTVSIVFSNAGEISREDIEHIFEKFYRLDNARQTKTGGAGLGLAIAREIVQAHGGTITADCKDGRIILRVILPADNVSVKS